MTSRLDVSDFAALVPKMAMAYPFELDDFQKQVWCGVVWCGVVRGVLCCFFFFRGGGMVWCCRRRLLLLLLLFSWLWWRW